MFYQSIDQIRISQKRLKNVWVDKRTYPELNENDPYRKRLNWNFIFKNMPS
jgi:hypothetical protein